MLEIVMRKLLVLLGICFPCVVSADVWDLYDNNGTTAQGQFGTQAGISCVAYNTMAGFYWRNPGGDWVDANGTPQGTIPQSSVGLVASTTAQRVTVDYTPFLDATGVIIRRSAGVVKLATRESTTPPVLRLTMQDGSVIERLATADTTIQFTSPGKCSSSLLQRSTVAEVSPNVVMGFGQLPTGVVSAALDLTVTYSSNKTTLQLFRLSVPRVDVQQPGPAIAANPDYVWRLTFDEFAKPCDRWWEIIGTSGPTAQWTQDGKLFITPNQSGLWCANGDPVPVPAQGTDGAVTVQRGTGAVGNGLMAVYHPTKLNFGVGMKAPNLRKLNGGKDLDSAWLSYWLKFGEDFHSFAKCEGGKLPGLKGLTTHCAGSSVPGNGMCGWSLRNGYMMACDPQNPAWGRMQIYMYAYHGLQTGYTGSHWYGNENASLELGKWHCIEQYVKVNTPGQADGIAQLYVNGNLTVDKRDVYLRGVRPELGYGDWRDVTKSNISAGAPTIIDPFGRTLWNAGAYTQDTELGIEGVYLTFHNGGITPPGKTAQMWLDEFQVSRERAGCSPRTGNPPPPAEDPPAEDPPAPSELDVARAALAQALSDIVEAQSRIAALEAQAEVSEARAIELQALVTDAEIRAAAARELLRKIHELTRE